MMPVRQLAAWRCGAVGTAVILLGAGCGRSSPDANRSGAGAAAGATSAAVPSAGTPTGNTSAAPSAAARDTAPSRARAAGGPEPSPTRPGARQLCSGVFVNVTVRSSALASASDAAARERALRDVATKVLAPVRDRVGRPELSPAIRAFRVSIRDSTGIAAIIGQLRASPDVEDIARDECSVRAR